MNTQIKLEMFSTFCDDHEGVKANYSIIIIIMKFIIPMQSCLLMGTWLYPVCLNSKTQGKESCFFAQYSRSLAAILDFT